MKLGKRIQSLRIQHNMTQKELSDIIGVSVVSIGGWENGTRKPSADAIISLSKVFNISTDNLLGVVVKPERDTLLLTRGEKKLLSDYRMLDKHGRKAVDTICIIEKSRIESERVIDAEHTNVASFTKSSARYIPRYTTPSAAGSSVPLDGYDFEMILADDTVPADADFAVGIQGNSMYPYIHDGDTVYVKKDTKLSIGDVGIFCVDGAMYCKQYYLDNERNLLLVSANPCLKHTNVYVGADSGSNVRCYGKVLLDCHVDLPDYIYKD